MTTSPIKTAIRADLLDFTGDPGLTDRFSDAVRFRPAHWLLIDDQGRIAAVQPDAPGDDWLQLDRSGQLLMPGFIDTHVHGPQVDVIASWGTELLDWLNTYTFPAEARHADPAVARAAATTSRSIGSLRPTRPANSRAWSASSATTA